MNARGHGNPEAAARLRAAAIVTALAVSCAAAFAGQAKLIEGFEDLSGVRADGGTLSPVAAAQGGTEGKQAAQLPARATVRLKLRGEDCRRLAWLKIDTMTAQPLAAPVRLVLSGEQFWLSRAAYLQPGQDTLAVPLTVFGGARADGWPDGELLLSLTNVGDQPLILDNVRLEAAAAAPPGSVLLDFGPQGQGVWPGFLAADQNCPNLSWSGDHAVGSWDYGYPDPLVGDFVGPFPGGKSADTAHINPPAGGAACGAVWVTHYGDRRLPPLEYMLRIDGRVVLHKTIAPERFLGPDGLTEGAGGAWTPGWFDGEYAARFCDVVNVPAFERPLRLDLGNCQLAALAMTPVSQQAALAAYIKQVEKDLSRFRRQFVVGSREEQVCRLIPTEAEAQSGLMVFQPKPDDAFSPSWRPAEAERLQRLRVLARAGGAALSALAAAPLKPASSLGAATGSFTTGEGKRAPARIDAKAYFFHRVPRVLDARVEFQPWLMSRKSEALKEREIAFLLLRIDVPASTPPGSYDATLTFLFGGARRELPLTVEVVNLPPPAGGEVTLGAFEDLGVRALYGSIADTLSDPQQRAVTGRFRQLLLTEGLNALRIDGPFVGFNGRVRQEAFTSELQVYPVSNATGKTILDVRPSLWDLSANMAGPGTQRFRQAALTLVAETGVTASKAGLRDYCYLIGSPGSSEDFRAASRAAEVFVSAGGAPAVETWANVLEDGRLRREDVLQPISVLMVVPNSGGVAQALAAFRKLPGPRWAYVRAGRPDRYAIGFYAAGVGADGCYLDGSTVYGGSYNGFHVDGRGLVVPQAGGAFATTLSLGAVWMGREDFLLCKSCQALAAEAAKQGVDAARLSAVLSDIQDAAAKPEGLWTNDDLMRSTRVTPNQMEKWRGELLKTGGDVAAKLKKP